MASKFLTNIDLVQNQILNGRFETVGSDPEVGNFNGRLIFNTTEGVIKVYDDEYEPASGETKWRKMVTKVTSTTTALGTSEANGVVSLSVSDVVSNAASGLMTGADKKKLDDATAADSLSTLVIRDGSGRFQVATPSADLDAANKGYVDSARAGLDVKQSVKVATTEPIVLSTGLEEGDEIDGYTLVAGDRVLVKDQDTASQNGIYVVAETGAPTRALDADSSGEVTPGMFTFVEQGTLNADSGWVLITDGDIALGTTGLEFSLFSVAGNILAGAGLSKTGDTLDVNVDETTIEINADALRIASGAAGDGLSGGGGSALSVNVAASGGIEIASDDLQIKLDGDFVGLATTADGLKIDSSIIDTTGEGGLAYDAGELSIHLRKNSEGVNVSGLTIFSDEYSMSPSTYPHGLKVKQGPGLTINASGQVALASSVAGNGLTFTDGVLSRDTIDLAAAAEDITGILPIANGGTSSADEINARYRLAWNPTAGTNGTTSGSGQSEGQAYQTLSLARIMAKTIGDGTATAFNVKHDFETRNVIVQVYDLTTYETVTTDVVRTGINTVQVTFSVAPPADSYKVVITATNPS